MYHALRMTMRNVAILLVAGGVLIGAVGGGSAVAQEASKVVIGLLDVAQINRDSKAAKSLRAGFEKQRETYQAEIAKQEQSLRKTDQELKSQQASLSPEDFQKKREELQAQSDKLRESVQARKSQLEKALQAGDKQIREALIKIVGELAKEKGVTLVLNEALIIWSSGSAVDLTPEALSRLDTKMPKISLPK